MTGSEQETAATTRKDVPLVERDIVELEILLPIQQASALEQAAKHRGLTMAQMVRDLIWDFLVGFGTPSSTTVRAPASSPDSPSQR
jgi:hypothetical protein